ncbi:MAG: hypothetical protein WC100_05650 [Sterolibacterium sp.]
MTFNSELPKIVLEISNTPRGKLIKSKAFEALLPIADAEISLKGDSEFGFIEALSIGIVFITARALAKLSDAFFGELGKRLADSLLPNSKQLTREEVEKERPYFVYIEVKVSDGEVITSIELESGANSDELTSAITNCLIASKNHIKT